MNKKYGLFFDIDGTLLDEVEDVIPDSAVDALKKAKENGHKIYVCSGRCLAIIPEEVKSIGFDGMICGCGTYIELGEKEVFHNLLDEDLQKRVIEDLLKYDIDGVLEGKEYSAFRRDIRIDHVKEIYTENGKFEGKKSFIPKTQCFWDQDFSFDKMALWHDEKSDMKAFIEKYKDVFEFIERDPTFYEAVPIGLSKATAIGQLCEMEGIDIKDTYAFGDSANDVSMLKKTGYSVAMKSGNPILFDKVDYVTDEVMNDGIYKAMEHFKLI